MEKSTLTEDKAEKTPAGGVLVGKREGQTIIHNKGSLSGYLVGRTHAEGGIKAVNKSTGQPLEVQGGEVVITAPAVSDQTKREFEGKMMTNREILSAINEKGGGVAFASGGDIPKDIKRTGASYKYGGKTMTDHEIISLMTGGKIEKNEANYGRPSYPYSDIALIHETNNENAKIILEKGFNLSKNQFITNGVYTIPIIYKNEKFDRTDRTKELVVWLKEGAKIFWTNSERPTDYYLGYGNEYYEKLYNKINLGHKSPKDDWQNKDYQKYFCRRMEKWLKENGYAGVQQGGEIVITDLSAIDYVDYFEREDNSKYITGGHLAEGYSLREIASIHQVLLSELKEQVRLGMKAESEHTPSKREQIKIVKDHLFENPKYYTLLKKAGLENGGRVHRESLVKDAKSGNTPARDLNNYNDVLDIDADGVYGAETGLFKKGGLIAPNGHKTNLTPEQYKLVRTPEFKEWFGDWENDIANSSKVVDSNGEPMVVYHTTSKDFTIFDKKKSKEGFFFSPNKERLEVYNKSKVDSYFLRIVNPSHEMFKTDL